MLEADQVRNLIAQIDDSMMTLHAFRMGVGEADGVTNNISRLGIARAAFVSVLEGKPFEIGLGADEAHEETVVTLDPNANISERRWWNTFRQRVEEKQGPVIPEDHISPGA